MYSIHPSSRSISGLLFFVAIVAAFLLSADAAPTDIPLKKSALLQKLDSIDVEKQIRKRKGLPLDDLEKYSTALKDSIAALRTAVGKPGNLPAAEQTDIVSNERQRSFLAYQKYVPRNAFDWIVLIVGGVAIIAGIILCIGFFSMLFGKKGKNARSLTTRAPPDQSPSEEPPQRHPAFTGAAAEEREIDSLRKRIVTENSEGPPADTPTAEDPGGTGAPAIHDGVDLKKRILAASRQGAEITEISRRFHISTDQVSLILRVAQMDRGEK